MKSLLQICLILAFPVLGAVTPAEAQRSSGESPQLNATSGNNSEQNSISAPSGFIPGGGGGTGETDEPPASLVLGVPSPASLTVAYGSDADDPQNHFQITATTTAPRANLTWSIIDPPNHGTATVDVYPSQTGSTAVVYYDHVPNGSSSDDQLTIQVSDGIRTATRQVAIDVIGSSYCPLHLDDDDVDISVLVTSTVVQITIVYGCYFPGMIPITVGWATIGGSAVPGVDYVSSSGTADFDLDNLFVQIEIPLLGNTDAVGNRDFYVEIFSPVPNVPLDPLASLAHITILDIPSVALSVSDLVIAEGSNAYVQVSVSPAPAVGFPIYATLEHVTSSFADVGFTLLSQGFIQAGSEVGYISLTAFSDSQVEEDEVFYVHITADAPNTVVDGMAVGTIVDVPPPPPPPGNFWMAGTPEYHQGSSPILVNWLPALNATSYTLKVSASPTCSSPIQMHTGIMNAWMYLNPITDEGNYYICITALNASGMVNALNNPWHIIVDQPQPSPIASFLALPISGSRARLQVEFVHGLFSESDASGVQVMMQQGAEPPSSCAGGTFFPMTPNSVQRYYIENLLPQTTYSLRECPVNIAPDPDIVGAGVTTTVTTLANSWSCIGSSPAGTAAYSSFLVSNPAVADAIGFCYWPADVQALFWQTAAESESSGLLPDVPLPAAFEPDSTGHIVLTLEEAHSQITARWVASIFLELHDLVPWSLLDYNFEQLRQILHPDSDPLLNYFEYNNLGDTLTLGSPVSVSPRELWYNILVPFVIGQQNIGDWDRSLAIANVLASTRDFHHASGSDSDSEGQFAIEQIWVDNDIGGGCASATRTLYLLARGLNIPSTHTSGCFNGGGHTSWLVPVVDGILAHGDDIYNGWLRNTPSNEIMVSYADWDANLFPCVPSVDPSAFSSPAAYPNMSEIGWYSKLHSMQKAVEHPSSYLLQTTYCTAYSTAGPAAASALLEDSFSPWIPAAEIYSLENYILETMSNCTNPTPPPANIDGEL